MSDLKKLKEEMDKFPWKKEKRKLIAFEDENGIVHITTDKGFKIYSMDKETYLELVKYKNK